MEGGQKSGHAWPATVARLVKVARDPVVDLSIGLCFQIQRRENGLRWSNVSLAQLIWWQACQDNGVHGPCAHTRIPALRTWTPALQGLPPSPARTLPHTLNAARIAHQLICGTCSPQVQGSLRKRRNVMDIRNRRRRRRPSGR